RHGEKDEGGRMTDEKEEVNITISSFITHPSYFLSSLRASVSPCLTSFISISEKVVFKILFLNVYTTSH
ncbi:MAG: hypothetical protein QG588_1152, partial [Candidatus Poribacteria bacterium]|nr:hypothetical protein [Candidatus Poribacteria bacterium]